MTRTVLDDIEDWEPQEARESVRTIQETLTAELDFDDGEVCLLIGIDDTLAPDYEDGPCNGFEPMVKIGSLAEMIIQRETRLQQLLDESDENRVDRLGIMEDFAEYLEAEAAKLRAAFANKARNDAH